MHFFLPVLLGATCGCSTYAVGMCILQATAAVGPGVQPHSAASIQCPCYSCYPVVVCSCLLMHRFWLKLRSRVWLSFYEVLAQAVSRHSVGHMCAVRTDPYTSDLEWEDLSPGRVRSYWAGPWWPPQGPPVPTPVNEAPEARQRREADAARAKELSLEVSNSVADTLARRGFILKQALTKIEASALTGEGIGIYIRPLGPREEEHAWTLWLDEDKGEEGEEEEPQTNHSADAEIEVAVDDAPTVTSSASRGSRATEAADETLVTLAPMPKPKASRKSASHLLWFRS